MGAAVRSRPPEELDTVALVSPPPAMGQGRDWLTMLLDRRGCKLGGRLKSTLMHSQTGWGGRTWLRSAMARRAAFICWLALFLLPAVQAGEVTVASEAELKSALANGNVDRVVLSKSIGLTKSLVVDRNVEISSNGNGDKRLKISPPSDGEGFQVAQGITLSFSNLFLNGRFTVEKSFIRSSGAVTFDKCHVSGFGRPENGSVVNGGNLTIENSYFGLNFAYHNGGVAYCTGPVIIRKSDFWNNTGLRTYDRTDNDGGGSGGVVYTTSTVLIENSNFTENLCFTTGAVAHAMGAITAKRSHFLRNGVDPFEYTDINSYAGSPGTIRNPGGYNHLGDGGTLFSETEVYFIECESRLNGAGFWASSTPYGYYYAGVPGGVYGGVVLLAMNRIEIWNSSFSQNYGRARGGVAYLVKNGTVLVRNSDFQNNGGVNVAGGDISAAYVDIDNSLFNGSLSSGVGGSLAFYGGRITNSRFLKLGAQTGGIYATGPMYLENVTISEASYAAIAASSSVEAYGCTFISNSGGKGSAVYVVGDGTASFENCTFINNVAGLAGAIWSTGTRLVLEGCNFFGNTAKDIGGAAITSDSLVEIHNTRFSNNSAASEGGAILMTVEQGEGDLRISNCTFEGNLARAGGAILVSRSRMSISDSLFIHNHAWSGGAWNVQNSVGEARRVVLLNNTADFAGGAITIADTFLTVYDSTASQNTAQYGGIAFVGDKATLRFDNSELQDSSANYGGGGAYVVGQLDLIYSRLSRNTATHGGGILNSATGQVNVNSTVISDCSAVGYGGGVGNAGRVFMTDATVSQCTAQLGGGVYTGRDPLSTAANPCGVMIGILENSTLVNNVAKQDGAGLYIDSSTCLSAANMTLVGSTLLNNTALSGGGVYARCSDQNEWCASYLLVSMYNNTAVGGGGGAILTTNKPFVKCSQQVAQVGEFSVCSEWYSNSVVEGGYGPKLATQAVGLDGGQSAATYEPKAPGAAIGISLRIVDKLDQTVSGGPESFLSALACFETGIGSCANSTSSLSESKIAVTRKLLQEPAPYKASFSGQVLIGCYKGVCNFTDLGILGIPGVYPITVGVPGRPDLKPYSANITIRPCLEGEVQNGILCEYCEAPSFSWNSTNTVCETCPENAICYGGKQLVPADGYWHSASRSFEIQQCQNTKACTFTTEDGVNRQTFLVQQWANTTGFDPEWQCAPGYNGPLCAACSAGYGQYYGSGNIACSKCWPEWAIYLLYTITIIINVILIGTTVRFNLSRSNFQSLVLKVMFTHMQFLAIVMGMQVQWPNILTAITSVAFGVAQAATTWSSLGCTPSWGSMPKAYQASILSAMMPIIALVAVTIFWSANFFDRKYRKGKKDKFAQYFRPRFDITIFVVLFFIYPGVTTMALSFFQCQQVDTADPSTNPYWMYSMAVGKYWTLDMNIQCFQGEHQAFAIGIGVTMSVLFGLGVPFGAFFLLWRYRKNLEDEWVQERFGFLYDGYKLSAYYWESVFLLQKLVLILVGALFQLWGGGYQLVASMGLLLFFLFMHTMSEPYEVAVLNSAQLISWAVLLIVSCVGMMSSAGLMGNNALLILGGVIILAANGAFFLFIIANYVRAGIEEARQYVERHTGQPAPRNSKELFKVYAATKARGHKEAVANKVRAVAHIVKKYQSEAVMDSSVDGAGDGAGAGGSRSSLTALAGGQEKKEKKEKFTLSKPSRLKSMKKLASFGGSKANSAGIRKKETQSGEESREKRDSLHDLACTDTTSMLSTSNLETAGGGEAGRSSSALGPALSGERNSAGSSSNVAGKSRSRLTDAKKKEPSKVFNDDQRPLRIDE